MRQLFRSFFVAMLLSLAVTSCEVASGVDDTGGTTGGSSADDTADSGWTDPEGVTEWIDDKLCEVYLYNEEYAALSGKNYDSAFDDFFYDNLKRLTTNTLDYKDEVLFSYIEATAPDGTTRSSSATANDFGFIHMTPVLDSSGALGLYILACYNSDSPVDKLGICRGMVITEVDGVAITESNYAQYIYQLLYPAAGDSYSLKLYIHGANSQTLTVTTATYTANPVLNCEIIDAANSVGYINYVIFESLFDTEMLNAFKTLKDAGAESLILDLRYNLGGYVSSASKMVSAISSTPSPNSQIFSYYRFNNSLTQDYDTTKQWTGLKFDTTEGRFYELLSGVASDYQLGLTSNTVYVLVGYNTASASEMVINSLKGMGYDVVLIGQTTRGKNVGMYVIEKSIDDYDYEMAPITFENFNCLGDGGYESGITPDYSITESEEMSGFHDFSADETLIAKALSLISPAGSHRAEVVSRSVESSDVVTPVASVEMLLDRRHGAMKRVEK